MPYHYPMCSKCKMDEVEHYDDGNWESTQCIRCNNRDIDRYINRAEWNEYHAEPCPEIELNKRR